MDTTNYLTFIFKIAGSLALLIYGMKIMSEALQKMAGPQLRHVLGAMTTNRFTGVLTGTFITSAVQSSTATTVMTVSFVSAGLLTLTQAISVIMGANIGTTLTAWIMSLGFSLDLTSFVFPAFLVGIVLIYSRKHRYKGDFLFGISFLFYSLVLLSDTGKSLDLQNNKAVIDFFGSFDVNSYFSIIIFLGIALVMGENIGTTGTANLVALGANVQARRTAMAHLVFNVFGVTWVLIVFYPFVNMICNMVGYNPEGPKLTQAELALKLPVILAAFHTCFNLFNTGMLIWFIPQIERVVCWIIKSGKKDEEEEFRLRFIQAGIMKTPELSVLEAHKEISSFAERMQRMFGMVRELLVTRDDSKFVKLYSRIEKYENISDNMEQEIAKYLSAVSDAHLSDDTKGKIRDMMREITELESIGDSCYNLARTISRLVSSKEDFTEKQYERIHQMFELTDDSLSQMNIIIRGRKEYLDTTRSFNIETEINNYRNQLRNQNINDIDNHEYTYNVGTMYMDIINECEKLADYVVNVVEARMGTRRVEA